MGAEIALVTANMGGLDPLFALPPHPGVDAFYYTDRPDAVPSGWTGSFVVGDGNPRLLAKRFKCQAHRLAEVQGCRWLAWADASFEFRSLDFLHAWAALAGDEGACAVLVPHPDRGTVAEEYAYVLRQIAGGNKYLSSRYSAEVLRCERAHFSRTHELEKLRLWAGGMWLFANVPRTHEFLNSWWDCVLRFSILDQTSMSPLLADHGIEPVAFSGNLYDNQHWVRHPHP